MLVKGPDKSFNIWAALITENVWMYVLYSVQYIHNDNAYTYIYMYIYIHIYIYIYLLYIYLYMYIHSEHDSQTPLS